MTTLARREGNLFRRVAEIIEVARGRVARSVNTAMVHAYWLIGREIVEVEQHGQHRAGYGDELIERLADHLSGQYAKGFGARTLRRVRLFYRMFPRGSALLADRDTARKWTAPLSKSGDSRQPLFPPLLGWAHYLVLMRVEDATARAFYEIEAAREGWSSRELERQIASLLFERLSRSRNRKEVLALAKKGQEVITPSDLLKQPFVLELLDLQERPSWQERDLEQAIIDRIEEFLLELGKGFCFVARQKRLTLDGDHFYVDLVLYHRLLRCFVLIDLKLGKLAHQDLGQMMMYVNWFDRFQRAKHERRTVGIVLCSEKNDAVVKITLPEGNRQILAASYQHYLPTERQLRTEVARSREEFEQQLHLNGNEVPEKPEAAGTPKRAARRPSAPWPMRLAIKAPL